MRNNNSVVILFIFILVSCTKSREDKIIHYLTNGSEKYWVAVREHPIKWYTGRSFNVNGTYTSYRIDDNDERVKVNLYHPPTWKIVNGNVISDGQGILLRIEYINEDVLVLNNLNVRGTLVFLKDEDQVTSPIADTTHNPNSL